MTDKMKTEELIAELRLRAGIESQMGTLVRAKSLEDACSSAADRLETILKAWREYDALNTGREISGRQMIAGIALRRAIEGDSNG